MENETAIETETENRTRAATDSARAPKITPATDPARAPKVTPATDPARASIITPADEPTADAAPDYSYLDRAIADVRRTLAEAAARSPYGNKPALLLASKYATAEEMNYCAAHGGVRLFGENRVSALLEKYDKLDRDKMELHFIGSLQTNKVAKVVGKVALIHSLDSLRLAEAIEKESAKQGIVSGVLVELNVGREPQKGGILPEDIAAFYAKLADFPHLCCRGMMAMAPKCDGAEDYRKYFRETYHIFLDIFAKKLHNIDSYGNKPILSMGMSGSFAVAAEEGSDLVRVGRAVFRPQTVISD